MFFALTDATLSKFQKPVNTICGGPSCKVPTWGGSARRKSGIIVLAIQQATRKGGIIATGLGCVTGSSLVGHYL